MISLRGLFAVWQRDLILQDNKLSHVPTQGQSGEGYMGAGEAQQSRHSVTYSQGMRETPPKSRRVPAAAD